MVTQNTQNGQKYCDNPSPCKSTVHKGYNCPCSTIITQIARRRMRRRTSTPDAPGLGVLLQPQSRVPCCCPTAPHCARDSMRALPGPERRWVDDPDLPPPAPTPGWSGCGIGRRLLMHNSGSSCPCAGQVDKRVPPPQQQQPQYRKHQNIQTSAVTYSTLSNRHPAGLGTQDGI